MPDPDTTKLLINAGTQLGRAAVEGFFQSRTIHAEPRVQPETFKPQIIVTNPNDQEEGCTYCLLTRQLAALHRYLLRATEKPELAEIYATLAGNTLDDAIQTAWKIPTSMEINSLIKHLHDAQLIIMRPFTERSYQQLATAIWSYTEITLTLAEEDLSKGE